MTIEKLVPKGNKGEFLKRFMKLLDERLLFTSDKCLSNSLSTLLSVLAAGSMTLIDPAAMRSGFHAV